jgi:hypothetical protein
VEVKSIKAANIKKTHEKLKAQLEEGKGATIKDTTISINSVSRIFGELMENSIKKSLDSNGAYARTGYKPDRKKQPSLNNNEMAFSARASRYGGSDYMKDIMNSIIESEDIRLNRAIDVLRRISDGTYETDYHLIAEKLLSHDILMRI